MRRTSSGSDLSSSEIFAAPTSYVYMAPQHTTSYSIERQMTMANDIEMRTRSPGGAIWPRRNNPATGGAYDPYRIPCFTAEITGGLLIASHMSLPCLPADPIFHLPLGAITSVQIRGAGEEAELFDAVSRWARLCCWHRIGSAEATLVLDVDAPNGWLHHGWAGGPPGWAGPMLIKLLVRDVDEWIERMGVRGLLDSASEPVTRPTLNNIA